MKKVKSRHVGAAGVFSSILGIAGALVCCTSLAFAASGTLGFFFIFLSTFEMFFLGVGAALLIIAAYLYRVEPKKCGK